ncbi:MAG: hypothetical protein U0930_04140 [Pirellulales bacterium]
MSGNVNPYQPSMYANSMGATSNEAFSQSIPNYCMFMFVTSLILSILRVFLVAFSVIGLLLMLRMPNGPVQGGFYSGLMIVDAVTGLGIAVLGISANALLLAKKKVGLILGYLLAVTVLLSLGIAAVNLALIIRPGVNGQNIIFMFLGAGLTMAIRFGLLVAYVIALKQFKQWWATRSQMIA